MSARNLQATKPTPTFQPLRQMILQERSKDSALAVKRSVSGGENAGLNSIIAPSELTFQTTQSNWNGATSKMRRPDLKQSLRGGILTTVVIGRYRRTPTPILCQDTFIKCSLNVCAAAADIPAAVSGGSPQLTRSSPTCWGL
jgi:hypothetical protein